MKKIGFGLVIVILFALVIFTSMLDTNFERKAILDETKYTLKSYTGVGSGVYKHGTIVKVVDGQPVVVGHFDDTSGKEYSGVIEIKEVK